MFRRTTGPLRPVAQPATAQQARPSKLTAYHSLRCVNSVPALANVVKSSLMACGAGAARDARVDDLDRFTERALEAHVAGRGALAVTLYTRAENLATQLHPDDTCLIPAWLRCYRALSLLQQAALANLAAGGTPAREDASAQDVAALRVQAGDLLQGVVAVIERRTTAGTTVRRKKVSLMLARLARSPLLLPVAEVWHVPQRGGGVPQALAGCVTAGAQPAASCCQISRHVISSCWIRSHTFVGDKLFPLSLEPGTSGGKRASR